MCWGEYQTALYVCRLWKWARKVLWFQSYCYKMCWLLFNHKQRAHAKLCTSLESSWHKFLNETTFSSLCLLFHSFLGVFYIFILRIFIYMFLKHSHLVCVISASLLIISSLSQYYQSSSWRLQIFMMESDPWGQQKCNDLLQSTLTTITWKKTNASRNTIWACVSQLIWQFDNLYNTL